jgi:hypothetical protein
MVINTYIIYESLEGLSCYNIIGGVGVPVSLRHNGLSVVRIRGSSAKFMEEFMAVGAKTKSGTPGAPPCTPAAAMAATDKNGKEHSSPWELIAMLVSALIDSQWLMSFKGGFYCAL